MRMRKIVTLTILAVALAIPGVSLAKKDKDQNGIGKGGVPAMRDAFEREIRRLKARVTELETTVGKLQTSVDGLESQFADVDGDGSFVLVPDCNDANPNVNPNATEIPGNLIDENCDGIVAP